MVNLEFADKNYFKLDLKDKKILYHLMINARQSFTTIAKKVRLSKESVQYRYKKMQERGIILRTYSRLNYQKLRYYQFHLLLLLDDSKGEKLKEFYRELEKSPRVFRVTQFNDNWDLEIVLLAKDLQEFDQVSHQLLGRYDELILKKEAEGVINVQGTPSFPEVKKLKIKETEKVSSAKNLNYEVDEKDLQILSLLCQDARISTYKIARKVKLSADAIGLRIKKLVKSGIIERFTCHLNFSCLGYQSYVFCFNGTSIGEKEEKKFLYYMEHHPLVTAVKKMIGPWDIKNYVVVKDNYEFHELIKDIKINFSST